VTGQTWSSSFSSCPRPGGFSTACSRRLGVFAPHGAAAFAPTAGAHVRLAFLLLLIGVTLRFLALRAREVLLILALTLVFRGAGFFQGDGDRLPSAFDLATLSSRTTLEFAMRELMHDASSRLSLSGRGFGHGGFPFQSRKTPGSGYSSVHAYRGGQPDGYPVPWARLTYNEKLGGYEVNISDQELKGAPKYGDTEWNWDRDQGRKVYDYYKVTPYWS
jgi:hypothetical protein